MDGVKHLGGTDLRCRYVGLGLRILGCIGLHGQAAGLLTDDLRLPRLAVLQDP